MKIGNLMAASALGLAMALGGAALAQQSQGQSQGTQQNMPSDSKSEGAGTGGTGTGTTGTGGTGATGTTGTDTTGTTGTGATGTTGTGATTGTTGTAATTESSKWYTGMRADELIGKTVRNQADEEIGDIDKIVVDSDGEAFAVVSVGGFLGIGDKEVAIALSRMEMGDDKVVLLSTEDEDALKAMPAYDAEVAGYTELKGDQTLGM